MSGPNSKWSGGFVAEQLGVRIHSDPASAVAIEDLVGLALRRNPKRAHLLVSTVLAKHVPTEPALVMAAGELLGAFVTLELLKSDAGPQLSLSAESFAQLTQAAASQLGTVLQAAPGQRSQAIATLAEQVAGLRTQHPNAVVLGYAETATGLGRLVANSLGAYYIHSTRHATPEVESIAGFEEGHSHATSHAMVPTDPHWLDRPGPVVLVDDEFSTGSTVINTIRELHTLAPHDFYVVAALIDLRSAADRARFDALAAELDTRIVVTALGTGSVDLGEDILERAATLIRQLPPTPAAVQRSGRVSFLELSPHDVTPVRSDRFGSITPPATADIAAIASHVAAQLCALEASGPMVVLGCEENMFLPMAVAADLAHSLSGVEVRFSTTTRSPIVPVDRDDYAIAGALTFASHDLTNDGPGVRFAYNLNGTGQNPGTIMVFPEPGTTRQDVTTGSPSLTERNGTDLMSLVGALQTAAGDIVVVLLPADQPSQPPKDAP